MHVRDATPEDAMAVFALHVAACRRLGRSHYTEAQVRDWADKRGDGPERYDTGNLLVAERDGEVVGFGECDGGEVLACYVHPDHAGTGVGSALVEHLHEELRDAGHERVTLTSSLNAVGFYERTATRWSNGTSWSQRVSSSRSWRWNVTCRQGRDCR